VRQLRLKIVGFGRCEPMLGSGLLSPYPTVPEVVFVTVVCERSFGTTYGTEMLRGCSIGNAPVLKSALMSALKPSARCPGVDAL
jgi:hypothetical protein